MAKVLKNYNFKSANYSKYPWSEWTDGRVYQITRYVDFTVEPASMKQQLQTNSVKRGLSVRVDVTGDTVTFQFSERV